MGAAPQHVQDIKQSLYEALKHIVYMENLEFLAYFHCMNTYIFKLKGRGVTGTDLTGHVLFDVNDREIELSEDARKSLRED